MRLTAVNCPAPYRRGRRAALTIGAGSLRFCCARRRPIPAVLLRAVVFVDAEKSSAIVRAERRRASIAESDFSGLHAPTAGGEEMRISASIGVACFPVDAQSPEALLEVR